MNRRYFLGAAGALAAMGLPIGLSFFGAAWSEPTLLRLASGFEHIAQPRPIFFAD